jgi:hypothetical protein
MNRVVEAMREVTPSLDGVVSPVLMEGILVMREFPQLHFLEEGIGMKVKHREFLVYDQIRR